MKIDNLAIYFYMLYVYICCICRYNADVKSRAGPKAGQAGRPPRAPKILGVHLNSMFNNNI
jgi:hypothetical protein